MAGKLWPSGPALTKVVLAIAINRAHAHNEGWSSVYTPMGLKLRDLKILGLSPACLVVLLVAGCGEKKVHQARVPNAPDITRPATQGRPPAQVDSDTTGAGAEAAEFRNAKPIYTEIGVASWYGPPYHNRKTPTGEVFDMNQPTAAHKTLPLNSIVRVTNLSNGKSAILRINDRGPFVGDRVIDLSMAAAKDLGVYHSGLAKVRIVGSARVSERN